MAPAKKKQKTSIQKYLCFSCDVERISSQFPDCNPTEDCKQHMINTCKTCLKKWVEAQVESSNYTTGGEDGKVFGIKCPECDDVMKSSDIEEAATKKVFAKFEEMERKHIADNTPGWRWCLAPRCRAGQLHQSKPQGPASKAKKKRSFFKKSEPEVAKEADICECHECGAKACVTCDRPWHEGETCEAYQLRIKDKLEEEDKALKSIQNLTKACPNCNKRIQKNGGCPSMICSQCQVNFCWNCVTVIQHHGVYCKCVR